MNNFKINTTRMVKVDSERLKLIMTNVALYIAEMSPEYIIDQDYYWLVGSDKWYNFSNKPEAEDVGSLTEDWHFLQRIATDDEVVACTDLDRLAAILRAISEQIAPVGASDV